MKEELVKIDRNGTKTWASYDCPRCGGSGRVRFSSLDNCRCWKCGGSGRFYHERKEYTQEYAAKLQERRLAKARKLAPEKNAKYWQSLGLAEDGSAWVAINKFAKADEMKPLGAKWCPNLGWHFPDEHEGCFFVSGDDIGEYRADGTWHWCESAFDLVEKLRAEHLPKKPEGGYLGEVGSRIEVEAEFVVEIRYTFVRGLTWGCSEETKSIYKFKAGNDILVWNTTSFQDLEQGKHYMVRGTVKEHSEYRGEKQTALSRCKIEGV